MSKGKRTRAAGGRPERRQLPPLRLGLPGPGSPGTGSPLSRWPGREASGNGRPYYAAVVDVHHDQHEEEDAPWSARITGDPSEGQQIPARTITGDTLVDLWRDVHDELQEIGDEVNNTVGTKWMLDGDAASWMELHDRERLGEVAVGVPGGLPTYRYRVGVDEEASALPVPPRIATSAQRPEEKQ